MQAHLRVLVVDDEPLARELMLGLLQQFPGLTLLPACSGGREALRCIRAEHPDVVFLDIEMPGMSGFEVVTSIQADAHMPLIVFATAYADYALQAFEVNAVDYVLKPLEMARLQRALDRVRERVGLRATHDKGALVAAITQVDGRAEASIAAGDVPAEAPSVIVNKLPAATADRPLIDRLPVRQGDSVQLLAFEEIDWVDAAGDYMCIHARGETHIVRCTMKQLSERLSAGPFVRIHRSTLVNLSKITEISPLSKGECLLRVGEAELKVSRNYRSAIQQLLP
jgi:two-component system LytT family response regulator